MWRQSQLLWRPTLDERCLDVDIPRLRRISLNKCPPRLHIISHQGRENLIRRDRILNLHLQQPAPSDPSWSPTAAPDSFHPDLCSAAWRRRARLRRAARSSLRGSRGSRFPWPCRLGRGGPERPGRSASLRQIRATLSSWTDTWTTPAPTLRIAQLFPPRAPQAAAACIHIHREYRDK